MYHMINIGGKKDDGWKIAYYPLFGTYKGEEDNKVWIEFGEPRALIEKPIETDQIKAKSILNDKGNDQREVPLRYLVKN